MGAGMLVSKTSQNESITFRIDSQKLKTLRECADENQVSLNTLVNQILTGYIEWDMVAVKAGYATIQKDILKEMFEAVDEEALRSIALKTADSSKDIMLVMTGQVSLEAFFSILRNRAKRSGFTFREYEENGMKKFILQHEMGRNWSVFFKIHCERLVNNAGHKAKVEFTDNTLIITVPA